MKNELEILRIKFVILCAFLVSSSAFVFAQDAKYDMYIGLGARPYSPSFWGIGPSIFIDNKIRWQHEISFLYTKEFENNKSRFGYSFMGNTNMFIKKRSTNSSKLFGMVSLGVNLEYYQRDYELYTYRSLQTPVKVYSIALLPGISLNYKPSDNLYFRMGIAYGPNMNFIYGPECNSNSSECYPNPGKYNDIIDFIKLTIYYKIK